MVPAVKTNDFKLAIHKSRLTQMFGTTDVVKSIRLFQIFMGARRFVAVGRQTRANRLTDKGLRLLVHGQEGLQRETKLRF